jgi:putative chitinase
MNFFALLKTVAPSGNLVILQGFASALPACIEKAQLSSDLRLAHFLAQACEETAGLRTTVEYASGEAYEGRRDLGNIHPGDGPLFKGRGVFDLTGRANYVAYGEKLGLNLVADPKLAGFFPAAALIAAQYWLDHNLNRFADADNVMGCTRAINGGLNGLASRTAYLNHVKKALLQQKKATP